MGIKLSVCGLHSIRDTGSLPSCVWFCLNCSMVKSPPKTASLYLYGAGFTPPRWLYILRRIIVIFPQIIPPLLHPYFSIACDFIQLHEQYVPFVENIFLLTSCLKGILSGVLSNG